MWKRIIVFIFFAVSVFLFSQQKSTQFYKDKFFIYQKIGVDSALIYLNHVFSSEKDIDQAFALTAKRYLLTLTGKEKESKEYLPKINLYLQKIPEAKENYTDLSHIYNILGNTDMANQLPNEALKKFIKADFFAQKNNDIRQHIKIKGNIAFVKLNVKQTDEAIQETKEVLQLLKENKNLYEKENFEIIYNNLFSNLGHLYSDKFIADPDKNKKYADSASNTLFRLLEVAKDEKLLAGTYLMLGTLNNKKQNYGGATRYYLKSLDLYKSLNFKDEIFNLKYNIGVNYYEQGDYKKSKSNFLEISRSMEKEDVTNIDYIFAQDYLSKIYLKEGKTDSVEFYSNQFVNLYKRNSEAEKKSIADLYKQINSKNLNDEISKSSSIQTNQLVLIIALLVVLVSITIYLLYQVRKKKHTEQKLNDLLLQVKNKALNEENPSKTTYTISNEKEAEIMNNLLELEEKKLYLKQEYNQAYVAKKLNTNTTYLSQTINKYMKKSFSEYTNELRINYILKELSENKKIRGYTTQALADLVGYKNGISFARTFKEKTGVTPFQYIEKLNAEKVSE
ncbi:helix-turn-helix domain-containing protein [Chryseobacterium daecheongense]|uniref:Helix-turn-helix domain-containing protein n=1 Tax=Chryseobacterium daecheongense TaxID=192389 RepID=A0A3N0VYA9_9FLAO|nr:helix-turn-helix domain-containing protein [Chryseobacterium daecheongense]ROH97786.1 helix-turn-helix domain-containing protein [Chryseobacterium daecheongense]TDX93050.1 helix-turn-helix protein [Chryseobacterium daecheongense]